MPLASRRQLLFGTAGLVAGAGLAACATEGAARVPEGSGGGRALLAAFPQSAPHVPAGVPTRLAYLITDDEGVPLAEMSSDVAFVVTKDGELVTETTVTPRSEGIPRAYVPLVATFPETGVYDVTATYQDEDLGGQLQVFGADQVVSPVVGQQLPPAVTPTEENTADVDPICTLVPECPFHVHNLEDVVGTGTRIVLLVATPAFCQTAFCGPTLGNLIDLGEARDDMVVIHSEVYKTPKAETDLSTAALAPLPEDYGLTIEPVLYVTDDRGTITARADAIIDRSEMAEFLG